MPYSRRGEGTRIVLLQLSVELQSTQTALANAERARDEQLRTHTAYVESTQTGTNEYTEQLKHAQQQLVDSTNVADSLRTQIADAQRAHEQQVTKVRTYFSRI